jgi:hypothetical protein
MVDCAALLGQVIGHSQNGDGIEVVCSHTLLELHASMMNPGLYCFDLREDHDEGKKVQQKCRAWRLKFHEPTVCLLDMVALSFHEQASPREVIPWAHEISARSPVHLCCT